MGEASREWLVTDQRGAFAMGTPQGIRTRKYHGFLLGIPGRAETCFLSELEIECNGQNLWPHRYAGPSGEPVEHPAPSAAVSFEQTEFGPLWSWKIKEGPLRFSVSGGEQGGIRLSWAWSSSSRKAAHLRVRPFWALRPLHGIGGTAWQWQALPQVQTGERRALIIGENGEENECALSGAWEWKEDPLWYRNFLYTEELERGYAPSEDLFAAGLLEVTLPAGDSASLTLAVNREDLDCPFSPAKRKSRAQDFVLTQPAGLVAGFPWFGEWGRDTFVSLPGIVAARLRAGENPEHVWVWAKELLLSWGQWIGSAGMLPNLIESGGSHQWESADATLWWCHAVA
ncbi:MAG: glycogen debranching enzyme N-terminal domain-containing protein, partial [Bdellovibrionota bacterium]